MTENVFPKRPTIHDEEVLRATAKLHLKWIEETIINGPFVGNRETCIDTLMKVLKEEQDGFERVCLLHDAGWNGTEKLVHAMSEDLGFSRRAVEEATEAWVLANAIRFPAKVDQYVIFPVQKTLPTGKVVFVRKHLASALVEIGAGAGKSLAGFHTVFAEDVQGVRLASPTGVVLSPVVCRLDQADERAA